MTPDAVEAPVFTPAPGAAPLRQMIAAQAALETRTLLRNGEQLLLTLVIPLLLLAAFGLERRYGVLKRLGATPLSRQGLIAAKTVTVIAVELLQGALILIVAVAIGW